MPSFHTPAGIAYDRAGPKGTTTVVLLHAGVADRRMWDPQWGGLTQARDTVRLDLRGFGESTRRPDRLDPVGDVLETLEHLGVASCHLVGSSLGSGVAIGAALQRPGLVRSLALCPPGGSLITESTPTLRAFFAAERDALSRDDVDEAVEANITTWVVGQGRVLADVDPGVTASVRVMQRTAFEVTADWHDIAEVEIDPPPAARLADVGQPVLLLVGGRDVDAVRAAADRLGSGLADVRRVDLPDSAHLPTMEEPQAVLRLLLGWLESRD